MSDEEASAPAPVPPIPTTNTPNTSIAPTPATRRAATPQQKIIQPPDSQLLTVAAQYDPPCARMDPVDITRAIRRPERFD